MRFGTRTDRPDSIQQKIESVERKLSGSQAGDQRPA
jgi:hypothetical protein